MKKTYKTLILIFFLLFTITFTKYYGIYEYSRIFIDVYNSSINVTIIDDIPKQDVLNNLEKYGKRYDMDIERTISFPRSGENKNSLTAYVFINDFDWFNNALFIEDEKKLTTNLQEGQFLSNIDTKDKNQVGKFSIFDDNSQEIYIRPLADMKNRVVESNYKVHLNNDKYTLDEIINIINEEQDKLYIEKDSTNLIYADMNIYYMYFIAIILLFILTLSTISFIYYIISRSKYIGIKKLYGYSNSKIIFEIFKEDIFKVVIFSNVFSILFITILLYFKNSFVGFKHYISTYSIVICVINLILMLTLTVIVILFKGKNNMQLTLKGKRRNIIILNIAMRIIISTIAIIILVLTMDIFNSYRIKNNNLQNWDKTKNLGFIGVNFSNTIDIDDQIKFYPYAVKLGQLWNDINDNRGIMAGYSQLFRSDIIEKEKMQPNLAYMMLINENYLNENTVLDENGNRIKDIDSDKDTVTVLVPSQFKDKEDLLKEGLRYFHLGYYNLEYDSYKQTLEINEGIRERRRNLSESTGYNEKEYSFLKQKIIYTQDNQKAFTYDTGEIDLYRNDFKEYYNEIDNTITDPILFIMTNENVRATKKYYAIMSGTMKFRFEDYKYPEDGIVPLLEKNGLLDNLIEITTVYDYAVDDINNTKNMFMLSIAILISCILIMLGLIFYESSNYLYRHRKQIGVFKLYGLNFFKRYKKYFNIVSIVNLIIIIISTIIGSIFLKDFLSLSIKISYLIILVGILFYLLELIITYLFLRKRENKSILIGLKGEL